MKRLKVKLLFAFIFGMMLSSCHTSEKIIYLQDVENGQRSSINNESLITIQSGDKISIVVTSDDPKIAAMYNLPITTYQAGSSSSLSSSQQIQFYIVDDSGNIMMPIVGAIHVEGLTRPQIATLVKKKLIDGNFLKDAVVNVDYGNLRISVLGEVKTPGKYSIDRDKITILDAISMAGDLTITGKRDCILVIREDKGVRSTYYLDLRKQDVFNSPAFYLQQNDIVYVHPNKMRAGQSTINENSLQSASMWVTISSFLTSLGVLLFK